MNSFLDSGSRAGMTQMNFSFLFLLFGFVAGQVFSISQGGIRVSFLDVSAFVFVVSGMYFERKRIPKNKKLLSIFLPFIGVACLSLLFASFQLTLAALFASSLYMVRFVLYLGVFFAIRLWSKRTDQLLVILWSSGITIAFLGFLQYFFYPNLRNLAYLGWDPHQYRLFSTLLDPNFTAVLLALTIFLGWYLWQKKMVVFQHFIMGTGVLLGALLLTYSRGGYVAFISGLIVLFLLQKRFMWLLIFLVTFIVSVGLLPRPGGEGIDLLRVMSIQSRIASVQEGIILFQQHALLGVGFNTLRFTRLISPEQPDLMIDSHSGAGISNSFVFILATTGILGLVTYFWIWWKLYRAVTEEKKKSQNLTPVFFVTMTTVLFVHSLFDNSLFYPYILVWIWIVLGSIIPNDEG